MSIPDGMVMDGYETCKGCGSPTLLADFCQACRDARRQNPENCRCWDPESSGCAVHNMVRTR